MYAVQRRFKPSKFNTCRKGWIRVPISKCGIIIKNKVKRVSRKRWGSVVKPMVTRRRKIKVLPKRPLKKEKYGQIRVP